MQHSMEHFPTPMKWKPPSFAQCFKVEGIAKLEAPPPAMYLPKNLWLSHCPPQSILCEDFFDPIKAFQKGESVGLA